MRTSLLPPARMRRFVAAMFAGAGALGVSAAATLSYDAPMHTQPADESPVVGTLAAGTSITSLRRDELAATGLEPPPPGWIVLRSSGPFVGFVLNRDVETDGNIKPGAEIRGQPLTDAPLLLVVEEGDVATAREPLGDWSRATIYTDLIVFVNALPAASRSQVAEAAPTDAPDPETPSTDEPAADATSDGPIIDTTVSSAPEMEDEPRASMRRRAPEPEPVAVETDGTPRTFVGYLMPTRRFLGRGPKYDYQLVDESGRRICLLDLSALLATSTIDSFVNRRISIYGPGVARPDVQDVIIRVQTLRLMQ